MPEPQLICTVNAVIASPMPRRSAAMRAGFISSAMTLTQPRMTSSKASGGNGWRSSSGRPHSPARSTGENRLPTPPPQGGMEQTEFVARSGASAFASASPPSRKGGATRASLALERVPFQRDGVGGLARRDRLGREIVDGDRGGDGGGGGAKL